MFYSVRAMRSVFIRFSTQASGTNGSFPLLLNALTQHPRVSGEINRAAIADELCHRWSDVEETLFENVKRVPPGHVIRVGRTKQVRRYWELPIPGVGGGLGPRR